MLVAVGSLASRRNMRGFTSARKTRQLVLYAWQWELYRSYLRSFATPTGYIDR